MEQVSAFNFYSGWELFWPANVTWGELREAANDENALSR